MTHRRRTHPFTPFVKLKRRVRRQKFVSLGWQIRQHLNGRGLFTHHHALPGGTYEGQRVPDDEPSSWTDMFFLGQRLASQGIFYNATVRSVILAAVDAAENHAYDRIEAELTAEEYAAAYARPQFKRVGQGHWLEIQPRVRPTFERFDGLSLAGLRARFMKEAIEVMPPIDLRCTLDESYAYGVGADFIVPEEIIGLDALARTVAAFRAHGEQPYSLGRVTMDDPTWGVKMREAIGYEVAVWENIDRQHRGLSPVDMPDAGASVGHSQACVL